MGRREAARRPDIEQCTSGGPSWPRAQVRKPPLQVQVQATTRRLRDIVQRASNCMGSVKGQARRRERPPGRPETDLTAPRGRRTVLYHFELQMAGVVLLTAMAAGAVSLWLKRRRERAAEEEQARADEDERSRSIAEGGMRGDGGGGGGG